MNKPGFFKLSILLLCLTCLNAYGQRKEISKQEFSDAYSKAGGKTQTLAYRIISKSEAYRGDELQSFTNDTSEFVPPDKNHFVSEMKMVNANKIFVIETIRIGEDRYKKESGGNWTKLPSNVAKPTNPISNKSVENSAKFYLTENALFGQQTANLYELAVEFKHTSNAPATNKIKESTSYRSEKRWISRDGLLLKMELEDEFPEVPKRVSRRTWTYEYDPNIKIEAPKIIEQEKK